MLITLCLQDVEMVGRTEREGACESLIGADGVRAKCKSCPFVLRHFNIPTPKRVGVCYIFMHFTSHSARGLSCTYTFGPGIYVSGLITKRAMQAEQSRNGKAVIVVKFV